MSWFEEELNKKLKNAMWKLEETETATQALDDRMDKCEKKIRKNDTSAKEEIEELSGRVKSLEDKQERCLSVEAGTVLEVTRNGA